MSAQIIIEDGGMESQLKALYAEREKLSQELGISDATEIVAMIRNENGGMESQLRALYAEREKLVQELGTSDASEIVARVRSQDSSMEWQLISLYAEREKLTNELGVADADEIVAMLRSLEEQLQDLYREIEGRPNPLLSTSLPDDSATGGDSLETQLIDLYAERESLSRELGVTDAAAVVAMVRNLETQLQDLYHEREERGDDAGQTSGNDMMESQLIDLYGERETLSRELGVTGAEEIVGMVRSLETQLQDLYREKEASDNNAASGRQEYDQMESQLISLYEERDSLNRELGVADASEILTMVRSLEGQLLDLYREKENTTSSAIDTSNLESQLVSLYAEREKLEAEFGVADADEVIAMIRNLERQLQDLYREKESGEQSGEIISSLETQLIDLYAEREIMARELGISSVAEVVVMVRNLETQLLDLYREKESEGGSDNGEMESQLVSLYAERESLSRELGVTDAAEVITMVRSLETQLQDLYREKESGSGYTPAATFEPAPGGDMMESQLIDLYGERETLSRELGVTGAEEIVGMVRSLETQLQDLYREKEASDSNTATGSDDAMEAQLIDLYADRERLSQAIGVTESGDILEMIRNLETQLIDLYARAEAQSMGAPEYNNNYQAVASAPTAPGNAAQIAIAVRSLSSQMRELHDGIEAQLIDLYADREQLRTELGLTETEEIVAMVRSLEKQLKDIYQDIELESSPASFSIGSGTTSELPEALHFADTVRNLDTQLHGLYEEIESQLITFQSEQASFVHTLGAADAAEIVTMVGSLENQLQALKDMERQLVALYADREELARELGVSESAEIVAMVRSLEAQLQELYKSRETNNMSFVPQNVLMMLPTMSRGQIDACDFGVVKVDDNGAIQIMNRYEADLGGVDANQVEGKNFFTQVAPCTNNRLIFGRFKDGVTSGNLSESVPYTFTYKMKPTNVQIQLYRDPASKTNWVLVKKR